MTKRTYPLRRDAHDPRDKHYAAIAPSLPEVPKAHSLAGWLPAVKDQGEMSSCTANALTSAREMFLIRDHIADPNLSRLFLYWHEREVEGDVQDDAGACLRDGAAILQTIGVCPEIDYPYVPAIFRNRPSVQAEADAAQYKITSYHRVNNLDELKHAIASGFPVVLGIAVYESFESEEVARTGIVPLPNKATERNLGGHAILAFAYDDDKQVVPIRNSWGEGWGDHGNCYLPYAMFEGEDFVMDMWAIVVDAPVPAAGSAPATPAAPTPPPGPVHPHGRADV